MATAIASIQNLLKEELAPTVRESLADIDDAFKFITTTAMGVERSGLGRAWNFIQTFKTGLSGGYKIRAAGGPGDGVTATLSNVNMHGTPQSFPSQSEVTATAFLQRTITLKEGVGNLTLPFDYLRADELDSSIGSAVQCTMEGTAKKVAHIHAIDFYSNDQTNFTIGDVGTVGSTIANNGTAALTIDFSDTEGTMQMRRLAPGLLVDFYDSTPTVPRNSSLWVVDQWDPLNHTAIFKSINGDVLTLEDDDVIVLKDSLGQGFFGLDYWTAITGTIFGIVLATFPHFKSLRATHSVDLDELILNFRISQFNTAYGLPLDTLISTEGVMIAYLESLGVASNSVQRFQRQGEPLKVSGGWDGLKYMYNGRPMNWLMSTYAGKGLCYIVKMGDQNIKRYVPPRLPGAGMAPNFEGADGSIEFVAPIGGATGIFVPSRVEGTAAIGNFVEAPFLCMQQICPDQIQGIRIDGLTEGTGA